MDWPASILLVLCLLSGAQCEGCTVSDSNGIITHPDRIQIHVLDNLLNGTLITEYTTDGVTGIDNVTNDYLDVKFDESTSKITVKVKDAYHRYEDTNNEPDITQRFKLTCASSETIIMAITLLIKDTDNHPTKFNQPNMTFSIPMPYPGGLEITQGLDIWAYDWDFSSEVEVKIEDGDDSNKFELQTSKESADAAGPGHGKKPIVVVRIYSKEQLTQKELKFNLIAQDTKNNGNVDKLQVTITRNETSSVPDSPIFSKPLYRTTVDDKMEPGDVLQIQDGAIEFLGPDLGSIDVKILEGDIEDHTEYFSVHKTGKGCEIRLEKKVTDTSIQHSLLTLQATIPKANLPGFAVVYVKFSDYACPTTTAAPTSPVTCPTTVTIPEESTVDPCTLCPCPTPAEVTCPTTVTTTVEPCTPCPTPTEPSCPPCEYTTAYLTTLHPSTAMETSTQSCNCPTVTEVQCPTTPQPSSCPPCECTTPTLTTVNSSTTVETSTQECNCPTVTEVQCPTTLQASTCQPCEDSTSSLASTSEKTTTPECICPTCSEVSCPTVSASTTTEFSSTSSGTTIDPCSSCPTLPCSTVSELTSATNEPCHSCPPCECTTESWTTQRGNNTQETTTTDCICPTCPMPPTCPPCENTTPNSTPVHSSTSVETSTQECNCPTVTQLQCPTMPEPPTCPPCESSTPYFTTVYPSTTAETSTQGCNCPTVTEVQCPTTNEPPTCPPCECTTPKWTTIHSSPSMETSTQECICPTVTEPPTCPPCEYTTPNSTTLHSSSTMETSTQECNCPTVTEAQCPTTPTCPPCGHTTPNWTTQHPSTTMETSTQECNCPTVTEAQCPTTPTCPPCGHTTPNWTTQHPSTTMETSTQECNCPTVTEAQCPTTPTCPPCEHTTPNWTTLHSSSTMETSTQECNCPTVTEAQCPTTPTCPPCEHTTPNWTTQHPSTTMETSTQECNCPTVTEAQCPTTPTCPPCEHTTPNWTAQHPSTTMETTTQIASCPPCECSTETLVTGTPSSNFPETTVDPCSLCTTHTAPVVTCPPCDWTSPFTVSNHPSTSKNSSESTFTITDTTVKDHTCPTCPEVTTTPCDCGNTTTPVTPEWTSTSCPEVTTTPCDCGNTTTPVTPEWTSTSCPEVTCTPCNCGDTTTSMSPTGAHPSERTSTTSPEKSTTPGSSEATKITSEPTTSHTQETTCTPCPTTCTPCPTTCTPCPTVTSPSTETTPEGHHSTNSHNNSSDHTESSGGTSSSGHGSDGTHGTTTPASNHSDITSSSWFPHTTPSGTSTTCECNCATCPVVTCPSTETTPEGHHSTNSHNNSSDHTESSGGTSSTGHGSDGTHGTTTSASNHSDMTSTSMFPHTRPSGTSTTSDCNCPLTCPQVTCPSTETTSEGHHSTNSHNNSSDHTESSGGTSSSGHGSDGTHGTTTSASNHSDITSSSWFPHTTPSGTSTTCECNCATCPVVTCPTTESTPEGTTSSHSNSSGHGSDGTTTSGSSHGNTTSSSWFSTPSGSGLTSECICPSSTESPGKTTSIPPTHGNLTLVVPNYKQHIMVGDVGHITWVVAKPHPPGIILVHPIEYTLDGLPDDLEDALMITDDGELVAQSPILQPGEYNFFVTAEIPGVAEKVRAKFILDVITAYFCGNSSGSDVIFPYGFLSKPVKENHLSLLTSFPRPENLNCSWMTAEKPNLGKVRVEAHEYINVYVDAINREDEKFNGAESPSILAEISASCVKRNDSTSAFSYEQDDDTSTTHSTLVILIHVTDENDSPPKFESDKLVVGYPVQKIAEEERPPFMGVARAHDDDVGDNAIISYSIAGTTEAIVNSENGQFYPHPKHFEYQNTSFQIIATDGTHQTTLEVVVKMLEAKYITILGIEGETLEDVPKLTETISEHTGLQIGVISAKVERVDAKKEKQRPNEYLVPKELVPNGDDFVGPPKKDDTLYLRLVLYALNGSEPVSVDQFNSSVSGIPTASEWKLQDYHGERAVAATSDSGSAGLLAGVIALSTILVLTLLGIVAVFVYRRRIRMRERGGGSLEKGLVSRNSGSDNSSIEGGRDNSSIVFESTTGKSDPALNKDEFPDGEAPSAERKKSVAFAEETMVIPSEEELEAMPAETEKGTNVLVDEDFEEDIRM